MSRTNAKPKHGVFCLDNGRWDDVASENCSMESALRFLKDLEGIPYTHRNASTKEELLFYLRTWRQKKNSVYPILYLSFHGKKGEILLNKCEKNVGSDSLPIKDLFAEINGYCKNRMIHISGCEVLNIHGKTLRSLLNHTDAIAISGYTKDIDWFESAILDMLLLNGLQGKTLSAKNLNNLNATIKKEHPRLVKKLKFRMVVKK